jgi:hypothetical protein
MCDGHVVQLSLSRLLQNVHAHGCLFDAYVAATILSEAYLRTFHLPIASFAPELGNDLVNLR